VQYARGTPFIWGTIKGIWLNTPCYKPSTLTSGLVNKTTTVPYKWDLAAYIQSILQEIGPPPPPPQGGGGRYDASSFTVDFLLEEIATAFDCQSAQPIPINDYPPPAGGR